jgi:glutathione-regulated potassium-efflux system ancillary protein KefG
MSSGQVLILLAHPTFSGSKANKTLIEAVKTISGVKIVDLYQQAFDAAFFEKEVSASKALVFQFPLYWASAPSQLNKWTDEIFTPYAGKPIVAGKPLLVVTTAASEYEAYRAGGRNQFTIDELFRPYQLQANHSGMVWQTPIAVYGLALETAEASIQAGIKAYREKLESLLK